ncbi:hypothetical protein FOA52_003388 [Chlamydomonas sp. UWO 241]|nr:hypothetical protein FOA52_003388 [Chlamydomonas sp. UWO 241]
MQRLDIDLGKLSPMSSVMYGAAFEEINHAGDGGLNPEMVPDFSFEALAYLSLESWKNKMHTAATTRHNNASAPVVERAAYALQQASMDPTSIASALMHDDQVWTFINAQLNFVQIKAPNRARVVAEEDLLPETVLVTGGKVHHGADAPGSFGLHALRLVQMDVKTESVVISNGHAMDGTAVVAGGKYIVRARMLCELSSVHPIKSFSVSFTSPDLTTTHGRHICKCEPTQNWQTCQGVITSTKDDAHTRIVLRFFGAGSLQLDYVSVTPKENWKSADRYSPFSVPLLKMLKDLSPKFLRFPGGAFVEGVNMSTSYRWKTAVGPPESRPGHPNANWGYWSTDALGPFEFMQLCQELGAEPVWVVNAGISQSECVKPQDLAEWVQDMMHSLQFLIGAADTPWGKVRASMGRAKPFKLKYVVIGNKNCLRPHYREHFHRMSALIRTHYKAIKIIANCDLGASESFDMWEMHTYRVPIDTFMLRDAIDAYDEKRQVAVTEFASMRSEEDVMNAVAEAGFMSAMERNCEKIGMVAYAPLMANAAVRTWSPDLIIFKEGELPYGTPSYLVQQTYRQLMGTHCARVRSGGSHEALSKTEPRLEASATCLDGPTCKQLAIKLINFNDTAAGRWVELSFAGTAKVSAGTERGRSLLTPAPGCWPKGVEDALRSGLLDGGARTAKPGRITMMSLKTLTPGVKSNSFQTPYQVMYDVEEVQPSSATTIPVFLEPLSFSWLLVNRGAMAAP